MNVVRLDPEYFVGKKVFLPRGGMREEDLAHISRVSSVDLYLMMPESTLGLPSSEQQILAELEDKVGASNCVFVPNFFKQQSNGKKPPSSDFFVRAWNSLIDDHMLLLILERDLFPFRSAHLKSARIANAIFAATQFIASEKPSGIFFGSTPHSAQSYLLARVAELSGCKVFYLQQTIFPWRSYLFEGLRRSPAICELPVARSTAPVFDPKSSDEYRYFIAKRGSLERAMPETEKQRILANKGRVFHLLTAFAIDWRRPHQLVNKYLCYRSLCSLANFELPEQYIIFYLHFQPERTTLPEGYGFTQQVAAIRLLECALPANVKIVVKEHPSTFSNACSLKSRSPNFYQDILSDKAVLAEPNSNPYELMDKSLCVCTITGTVAGEALFRGVPAIVFGAGPLCHIKTDNLLVYEEPDNLKSFLESVCLKKQAPDPFSEFRNIFEHVMKYAVAEDSSYLNSKNERPGRDSGSALSSVFGRCFVKSQFRLDE